MKHKTIHRGARGLLLALSLLAIAAFAHGAGQPTARSAWATMHPAFHSAGAQFKGAASASAPLSIVVSLKLNNKDALDRYILAQHTPGNPAYRHWLSHAESTSMFGPTQAQAQAVADYLTQSGFTQVQISPSRLLVSADGTVALAQRAFNTQIGLYSLGGNSGLANTTAIQVPAGLTQIDHVLGLDTVTRVHTHLMRSSSPMPVQGTTSSGSNANAVKSGQRSGAVNQPAMGTGNGDGYYPEGFATVYNAGGLTAASTTVAVIGWGDMTNPEIDLQQLATRLGTAVTTSIVYPPAVSNGNDDSGQSEWAMDAQAIVGIAGSVNELIFYSSGGRYVDSTNTPCVTYDPANCGSTGAYSDQLLLAIAQAVSDNKATVINMSWGAGECGNPANVGWADSAFALGTIQGQTFAASTGDNGSYPCAAVGGNGSYGDQTQPSTEYPSTSPYVVAVGGTTLTTTQTGATSNYYDYSLETGWAYSGGGVSAYVSAPSWQSSLSGTNRQVPDVAFNGDPDTGIIIYLTKSDTADIAQDGWGSGPVSGPGYYTNGGTSLSSPLFVGAWAVLQSANGNNLGFAAPALYAHALAGSPPPPPSPPPFHDVPMGGTGDGGTVADSNGGNGTYVSKSGYDNVTGWGSFDITKMLTSTITQTITFTSTAPVNPVVGSTYTVTATGGASGNPVVFSIDGTSTAGACTVVGSLVTFTGVGTCIIDANQAGDGTYTAATQKQQTINVISPTPQTITFTSTAPVNPVVGSTYTVTATGGTSGNPVTFTIDGASTAGACTLTGSVVTFTGGGTCIIDANQAGNATYAAAPQAQQTINILGVQTITFTSTAPVNPAVGSTYAVTATGGASGNPVTLTIDGTSTAGACTVAGSV
ncbi:MAG: S53 family peptidase, partial [Rhodanobacter sp.]|nr:S53 family peptidase [Rhodanobacter sp.]